MVYLALGALIVGIFCGNTVFSENLSVWLTGRSEAVLIVLMFLVGISVGGNKQVFKNLKEYHWKIFMLPFGTITATLAGGWLCAVLLKLSVRDGLAVASGLGWYSLSGVMLTELAGPQLGTLAFLSNLMREILSFLLIPFIVKHLNTYAAIAPAGATSEDTTLPMLIRYTDEKTVMLSVFHGILCSAAVPILIRLIYS